MVNLFHKSLIDQENRKIKQFAQYGDAVYKAAIGIGIGIGIYFFAKWAFPSGEVVSPDTAKVAGDVVANATILR